MRPSFHPAAGGAAPLLSLSHYMRATQRKIYVYTRALFSLAQFYATA